MSAALHTIFVVFKTHFDIGFTGLVEQVLASVTDRMIPRAVEACRASRGFGPGRQYTWTLPAWPLAESLARLEGTSRGEELARLVAEGRIAWHALPFTTHTELFGLEDLIRGLFVGRRLGARFGRSSISAKMTDVPGHTWILPTILKGAGVSFLHLGCNACSTPPEVPLLFDWEGPDGSRVATMYSPGGYGTSLLPPDDWKLPVWLALQHTSDNVGPQAADVIPSLVAEVAGRAPGVEVRVGSLDEFAAALAGLRPDLPVVRKDLGDSWVHGAASMPRELAAARELRGRLVSLESARALRGASRGRAAGGAAHAAAAAAADSSAAAISSAYEWLLLFGEHTWGMDTKLALNPPEYGGRVYDKAAFRQVRDTGRYDLIRRSWRDKAAFVDKAQALLPGLEQAGFGDRDAPVALPAVYDVVNHQPWQWTGEIRVGRFDAPVAVTRLDSGAALPVFDRDGETWARVDEIPPLGAARISVQPRVAGEQPGGAGERPAGPGGKPGARPRPAAGAIARAEQGRLVLENGGIRVVVDPSTGGISSLLDLSTGREWVDPRFSRPFGAYQYDIFSRREIVDYLKAYAYDFEPWFIQDFGKPGYPWGTHRTFSGEPSEARIENGPGWGTAIVTLPQPRESVEELGNPAVVTLIVTLRQDCPYVDLEYRLTGKDECPLLEAGHVVLPVAARRPRYAVNKTGCVIDPSRDIARGANRLLQACERWIDVEDEGHGLLVLPLDSPLFSIGSMAIERFDGGAGPGDPVLYFNLFNTQWGTNFPQWIGGDLRFRFRLAPHAGDWRAARAWALAAAAFQPPAVLPVRVPGAAPPGLLLAPVDDLETVVCKRAEEGEGLVIRFQDPTGRGGRRTVRLADSAGASKVFLCTLLENELREVPLAPIPGGVALTLELRPFEIVTLKLAR